MILDFSVIWENLPQFLHGVGVTLQLLFVSLAVGFVWAVPLALMRVSGSPWLNLPVWFYTYVIRATP